jgi:predicted outer membrane repeat protein
MVSRLSFRSRPVWLRCLLLALLAATLAAARPARAIDLTAGTEAELNAAIAAANAAGAGTHTISLTADITLTAATTPFDNPAATAIILDGHGHTINGNSHGPLLSISPGTTARVSDVALTEGWAESGGAIYNGGALTVEDSDLSGNVAESSGGGIQSDGDLTLVDSTVNGNTADSGGAVALTAEAITATLIIRNSTFFNNTATANGGGLYVHSTQGGAAEVTINGLVVQANKSTNGTAGADLVAATGSFLEADFRASNLIGNVGYHGGLALIADGTAEVNVIASAVVDNFSSAQGGNSQPAGGGIYARSNTGGTATLTVFNSTLSGNSTGRAGGGLLVAANGGAAGVNVVYSTLAENTAAAGGGSLHTTTANGGVASVRLAATLISNGPGAGPNCARLSGAIISTGFNLGSDGTCFLNQDSDLPATPAGLRPLEPTATGNTLVHPLNFSSPARDRLPHGALGCGMAITTDQRGVARPQPAGGRCDIGAYERQPGESPEFGLYLAVVTGE